MVTKKDAKLKKTSSSIVPVTGTQGGPAAYNPYEEMDRFIQATNRRFANAFRWDPFGGFPDMRLRPLGTITGFRPVYSDLSDRGDAYTIRSDLPGVTKEDIEISIKGNRLEISAKTNTDTSKEEGGAVYRERSSGTYFRSFHLPEEVNSDKAEAKFENGVLTLTIPKRNPTSTEKKLVKIR